MRRSNKVVINTITDERPPRPFSEIKFFKDNPEYITARIKMQDLIQKRKPIRITSLTYKDSTGLHTLDISDFNVVSEEGREFINFAVVFNQCYDDGSVKESIEERVYVCLRLLNTPFAVEGFSYGDWVKSVYIEDLGLYIPITMSSGVIIK